MRRILTSIVALNLFLMPVYALDFDTSVDDEIRKKYNPSKLEQDMALPPLPGIIDGHQEPSVPIPAKSVQPQAKSLKTVQQVNYPKQTVQKQVLLNPEFSNVPKATQENLLPSSGNCVVLKKGTKFEVKLLTPISDKTRRGAKLKFVSKYPVSTTYYTIPMGTVFYGEVIASHRPQFGGNGGMLKIKISSAQLAGEVKTLNATISEVNNKNVYFNNIKGKNRYLKNMAKKTKPGRKFFAKMMKVTGNLATDGSSIILTPFSIATGVVGLGANFVATPVLALFSKGDNLYLKEGTNFEINLVQDVFIYN